MFIPKHCLDDLSKYRGIDNEHKPETVIPKINRINPSKIQEQIDTLTQCFFNSTHTPIEAYIACLEILKKNVLGSSLIKNASIKLYLFE